MLKKFAFKTNKFKTKCSLILISLHIGFEDERLILLLASNSFIDETDGRKWNLGVPLGFGSF